MADIITYKNKVDLVTDTTTADEYKWCAADANQVKSGINGLNTLIDDKTKVDIQVVNLSGNFSGNIALFRIGKLVVIRLSATALKLNNGNNVITNYLPYNVDFMSTTCANISGYSFYGFSRLNCGEKSISMLPSELSVPVEVSCTFVTVC